MRTTSFDAGQRELSFELDIVGACNWQIRTTLDSASRNSMLVKTWDVGLVRTATLSEGTRGAKHIVDHDRNFDWIECTTAFDGIGRLTSRITECGNGLSDVRPFASDGRLVQRILTDISDDFDWRAQTTDYAMDGTGVLSIIHDDGTILIA